MHFFLYLSYLIPYDSQMEFWLKLSWIFFFTQVLEKKKKGLDQLELNLKKEKNWIFKRAQDFQLCDYILSNQESHPCNEGMSKR